jgi:hypothetical protein
LGLRIGLPALVIAIGFLIYGVVTGRLNAIGAMKAADRAQMTQVVQMAAQVMVDAGAVVVVSLMIRLFRDEIVGQALTIFGGLLLFGSPILLVSIYGLGRQGGTALPRTVVDAFRLTGAICFLPGLMLLLRDAILRIWNGLSVKRLIASKMVEEQEGVPLKKSTFSKVYATCWDMNFCRGFVRKVCPAYAARKSCWRIKVGCYCDEQTILKAMMSEGKENVHTRGIMKSLGLEEQKKSKLSKSVRKQRCKRCGIYAEHQRQKYQLLSPVIIPGVFVLLYAFHVQISAVLWAVLQKTDSVMSALTYKGVATQTFADSGPFLTGLAFAWLSVIVISYALRLLEYLVFELQV